jgi:hypothetical protein
MRGLVRFRSFVAVRMTIELVLAMSLLIGLRRLEPELSLYLIAPLVQLRCQSLMVDPRSLMSSTSWCLLRLLSPWLWRGRLKML